MVLGIQSKLEKMRKMSMFCELMRRNTKDVAWNYKTDSPPAGFTVSPIPALPGVGTSHLCSDESSGVRREQCTLSMCGAGHGDLGVGRVWEETPPSVKGHLPLVSVPRTFLKPPNKVLQSWLSSPSTGAGVGCFLMKTNIVTSLSAEE